MFKISIFIITLFLHLSLINIFAEEDPVRIAVASNFVSTLEKISKAFTKETGYKVVITSGSTGTLHAQIIQGAAFDVFLSADALRAKKLDDEEITSPDALFTYAIGTLALWYPSAEKTKLREVSRQTLLDKNIKHISIANPNFAPYGLAAKETLINMKIWQSKQENIIFASNISGAFHFVISSSSTCGFVALSQLLKQNTPKNQYWIVPDRFHQPIEQQAILLKKSPKSTAFMHFLTTNEAKIMIINDGYKVKE